jgi:transposase-like protein
MWTSVPQMPVRSTFRDVVDADPGIAHRIIAAKRWPSGVSCPHCNSSNLLFMEKRYLWQCRDCRKQFTVNVGTIFEDSPIKLDKWLCAFWLITNAKNGISSCELHRALGVTQKTAWFMLQRIRLAIQSGSILKIGGHVEVDETFIGGKARNMHKGKRKALGTGPCGDDSRDGFAGTQYGQAIVPHRLEGSGYDPQA